MAFYRLLICVGYLIVSLSAKKIEDVQDLDFEPRIAICQKVAKHINVDTGKWTESGVKFCSSDPAEILQFCKKTYPNIEITNIVEANENVTICDDEECKSSSAVVPYRCLVGEFEADALSYPPSAECNFGYVHEGKTCKNHAYWSARASQICKDKGKHLSKYGILVPCGTDLFNGVEYVCCKKSVKTEAGKPAELVISKEALPTTEAAEATTGSKTDAEILEDLLNKFAAHIPEKSKGCDRAIYATKLDLLHAEKDGKVKKLAKNLNEAKSHMEELKKDDPEQAKALFKKTLQIFQRTLKNIESQAKLDESQVSQDKKACAQMALNHKKHLAMKSFVDAIRENKDKPAKIIKTFQRLMHILENDQDQNMRSLSKKLLGKGGQTKLMAAKKLFLSHLNVVKTVVQEGVDILKNVKSVHGEIDFNLPPFAADIDFEFAHKPKTTPPPPTTEKPASKSTDETLGLDEDEASQEHEHDGTHPTDQLPSSKPRVSDGLRGHHRSHPLKSRAVFAAVIGLSCGALVIMIVIVLALFFRKPAKRGTKTVIADDNNVEKKHLLKMQEDGFENPTYKFFAN